MSTIAPPDSPPVQLDDIREIPPHSGGGKDVPPPPEKPGGGDGGGSGQPDNGAIWRYRFGAWLGVAVIVMMFGALTSAMILRRGFGYDWEPTRLPEAIWFSTILLLASSYTMERAKRAVRTGESVLVNRYVLWTGALGGLFVVSQAIAWVLLMMKGHYIASNPSTSFFYLFTAGHAIHLVGGVIALAYTLWRVLRPNPWPTKRAVIEATTIYWHFLDILWLYLLALLLFAG